MHNGLKYQTLLFDLDGTIIDSIPDVLHAFNRGLNDCGYDSVNEAELRTVIGRPLPDMLTALGRHLSEKSYQLFYQSFRNNYGKPRYYGKFYPSMLNLLQNLKQLGVKLAIVTTKGQEHADEVCRFYGLDKICHAIVGRQNHFKTKPAPDQLYHALLVMGSDPSYLNACAMIGDTENDIVAGKAVGIATIGVTWGYRSMDELKAAGAQYIVTSIRELELLLLDASEPALKQTK